MDFACLQDGLNHVSSQIAAVKKDHLLGLVLFSVLLAVPLAPVVLALYQRRVQRLMSLSAESAASFRVSSEPSAARTKPDDPLGAEPTAELLLEASAVRERALWKALALAVTLFSIGIAVAMTISPDSPGALSRRTLWEWILDAFVYLLFVGSLCAPMVLLGVASTRFAGLFWKWFAPVFVALVGIAMIFEEEKSYAERVETFVQGLVILIVLYVALGGRRMRNVVPLLSVIICLLVLAIFVLDAATTVIKSCTDEESIVGFLVGTLTLAGLWIAWRAVLAASGGLARAYERKLFSDAQFQVGAWMAVITVLFAFAPGYTELGLNPWSLGVIPPLIGALWLYKKLVKRIKPWKPARALLLLRVFARDKRGEQLLDEVAFRWRFIGPIHMIGGPDLAKTNLEPNELLLFLRRRLRQIFVTNQTSLQRRLAALDWEPDPDVRYRINESYCSDNMWQEAVGELLRLSDAVLLDLRGFTAARRGTAFEIRLLAERDALKRSVVLIDGHTDLQAIEQSIADIPGAAVPKERVLRSDKRIDGNDIFTLLANGAVLPRGTADY
jgi:hypothetical protein